jgi:hypothetical protein
MKKLFLLIIVCFLSTQSYSQKESNTVIVKSIETYGSFSSMSRSLYVVDENGNIETTELEKHNTRGIPENMKTIKSKLDKYFNSGYELISSDGVSFGGNGVYTIEHTYIFKKKE